MHRRDTNAGARFVRALRHFTACAAALLAAAASAQQPPARARAFARDSAGAFWTVLDDAGAFRAEKRTAAGAFVAATALPDALAAGKFDLAFDASGNAWVLGTKAPSGLAAVGLWKVSGDGRTLLASGGVGAAPGAALGGGLAVDAAGNVWVTGARQTGADETFQLALWRFAPDATPNQAPTYVQRPNGGQLDYGADLVIDPAGALWVVGASSNPVTSAIDLAFWSFDAAGAPSGGPHLWPDVRPAGYRLGLMGQGGDDDGLAAALALRADGSLWAATSKRAAACANPDLALLRLSPGGTVAGATYWRDAAAMGAAARGLAADASGGLFAVGTAAGRSALWRFGAAGQVVPGYPRAADGDFLPDLLAVAPSGSPWVVVSSAPAAFTGGTFVAGTEGPSVCGAAGTAQISGTLTYPAGLTAGTQVGVFGMRDFFAQPSTQTVVSAPGGQTVPYTLPVTAPGAYRVVAQVDPSAEGTPGRPLGVYQNFTPVAVRAGQQVSGIDILLSVDQTTPTASATSFVDGSTLTALSFIEGTASDNAAVSGVDLAVEDLNMGLWWSASERRWIASIAPPLYQDARAAFSGHPADAAWQADVRFSTGFAQGLGPLAGYLAQGHTYRLYARAEDMGGNSQTPASTARFTWQGPQGDLAPNPPQDLAGQALGVSSISWTWSATRGADSYVVYSASAGSRILATAGTAFLQVGLASNTLSGVCVSAVNAFGEGPRSCGPGTFTLAAVPGTPTATAASSDTLTWAWDKAGNDYQPTYELSLSTDAFVTLSVLIPFAAQLQSETTTVFGLTPATAYQARVRAANGTGVPTAYSAPGSTRTLSAPPGAPTGLAAAFDATAGGVRLSWSAAAGTPPAYYLVLRRSGADQTGFYQTILSTTAAVVDDRPFGSGTYFYQVKAVNADGLESAPAGPAAADFDVTPPQPVTDLGAVVLDGPSGLVRLTWSAPADDFSGVRSYDIRSATYPLTEENFAGAEAVPHSVNPAAPGSLETFSTGLASGPSRRLALRAVDLLGNRSSLSNFALLDFEPPSVQSFSLTPGQTVSRPVSVTAVASDDSGVASTRLRVDGVVLATGAAGSAFRWDIRTYADGSHSVAYEALDAAGNVGLASAVVSVLYQPPASPSLTEPLEGFITRVATVNAAGYAEPGTTVEVLVNGVDTASAAVAADGRWELRPLTLPTEGSLELLAVAFEARGFSAPSFAVHGVFSSSAPNAPVLLQAEGLSGGRAALSWQAPLGKTPDFYRVYRSTSEADLPSGGAPRPTLRVADNIRALHVTDQTPADNLWLYAVTAVDGALNESNLSETVYAVTDRQPPTASVRIVGKTPPLGPGAASVELTVSEVLAVPPLLTFNPAPTAPDQQPAALSLSAQSPTVWRGTLTVTAEMPSGTGEFGFQGTDLAGNAGTAFLVGRTVALDTRGPQGSVTLSKASPVNAGTLRFTLTLDEPGTPSLSFRQTPLTLSPAGTLTWDAETVITPATGEGTAFLVYSATDTLGNVSHALTGGTTAFVIDTVAPGQPAIVRANEGPGGTVLVTWSAPFGETPTAYRVFRDSLPIAIALPSEDGTGSYMDHPAEGLHGYEVSSLDAAGNESAATDPPATADATPPAAPVNLTAQINEFGQIAVTWGPGDADSLSFRLYTATYAFLSTAGLTPRPAVSPFVEAPAQDGTFHYAVAALDRVGNQSALSNQASVFWDRSAPVISVSGVTDGEHLKTNATVTFSAADANLASVQATLDGQPFTSGGVVSAEGPHTLTVTASDTGGHQSQKAVSFTIDKTRPQLAFTGASEGAVLLSTVSVGITLTELYPAASSFLLTHQALGTSEPYVPGAPILRDGQYTLTASAADRAGNATTATLSFRLDVAPIAPTDLSVTASDTAGALLAWAKPEPDVTAYKVYKNGLLLSVRQTTTYLDAALPPGAEAVYEIAALDGRGNEGARARATVPALGLTLSAPSLTRGYFDKVGLTAVNGGTGPLVLGPAKVELLVNGLLTSEGAAPQTTVAAGQTGTLVGVLAVPAALPAGASLRVTAEAVTDLGARLSFIRAAAVASQEPATPLLEAFPDALVPGTQTPVRVRFYNRGTAPLDIVTAEVANATTVATNQVKARLLTTAGALFAQAGLNQTAGAIGAFRDGKQVFFVTVPPKSSILLDPVRLLVPNTVTGDLSVEAVISTPTHDIPGLNLAGTRGFASSAVSAVTAEVPYRTSAAPDRAVYDQGSTVTISGLATDLSGNALGGALVAVHVVSNGFDRAFSARAGADGRWTGGFFPLPGEAGNFGVFAAHPDVVSSAIQATFSIVGFGFGFSAFNLDMAQNSSVPFEVELANSGEEALEGLSVSTTALTAQGVTLSLPALPARLEPGARATLGVTAAASFTASTGTLALHVSESHGFTRTLPITAKVSPAIVIPRVEPQAFQLGVLGGEIRTQRITVSNVGFDTWRGVSLTAPALPWVKLQGLANLGDIAPGANVSFTLAFEPPSSLPNGVFQPNPLIQLLSLNAPAVDIRASVAVTSSRTGGLLVSVIDADKPRSPSGQGVPVSGVTVTMTSLEVAGLTFKVAGDLNGVARFSGIPSGRYTWRAEATGYQTASGMATVEPGLEGTIEAILATAVVTYEWSVTPTSIQDKYDITLNLTFKTDVPAPALIIDPPAVNLAMSGGQTAYAQYTITNRGLVSAFDVELAPLGDESLSLTLPFTKIAEIKAGQSVNVPVKLNLATASCHGGKVGHNFRYPCAAGNQQESSAPQATFSAGTSCGVGETAKIPPPPVGGGGGGGTFGGGGSDFVAVAAPGAASNGCSEGGGGPKVEFLACNPTAVSRSHGQQGAKTGGPGHSPALYYSPRYNSFNPQDGPAGFGWSADFMDFVTVNPDGTLTAVDPNGTKWTFVPAGRFNSVLTGNSAPMSAPKTVRTRLRVMKVDGEGKPVVVEKHEPNGDVTEYKDVNGKLQPSQLTDKNGNTVRYERDGEGRLVRLLDVHGRTLSLAYNPQGKVAAVTDPAGQATAYGYDAAGNLASETDVNGDRTEYAYDAKHRLTQVTYPNGGHTFLVYDSSGQVRERSSDGGDAKETFTYFQSSSTVTDVLGRVTTYEWTEVEGRRFVTRLVDPQGNETRFDYDVPPPPLVLVGSIGDGGGSGSPLSSGQTVGGTMELLGKTDALGRRTAFTHDGRGELTSVTDPAGGATQLAYAPKENPTVVAQGANQVVVFDGARMGEPVEARDAKGNLTKLAYDAHGNLVQVQDALNNFTSLAYNVHGNVTEVRDALGRVSTFKYDPARGPLIEATDPLGRTTRMTRDALSRPTDVTDPKGKTTTFGYAPAGELTRVTDALGGVTTYGYRTGREGRLLEKIVDAERQLAQIGTTLGYDVQGRLTSVTNALGQGSGIVYDQKGRPTSATTRNGQTFTFGYDSLDRLTSLTAPEGSINLTYDAVGRVTRVTKYDGSALDVVYDALDRAVQVTQTLPNGHQVTLGYTFDANGNRQSMTTPWGTFAYAHDAMNRVTNINNPFGQNITFTNDALGRRTKMGYPNGAQTSYAYDPAGQIGQVLHQKLADQSAIWFTNYEYDLAGNRNAITDADGSHTFTYDDLHRLTAANHGPTSVLSNKAETFAHDKVGNRTADALRSGYTYNAANRLLSDSKYTYITDAEGNTTSRTETATGQTTYFDHDSGGRMVRVRNAAGTVATYKYNLAGDRSEKVVGATTYRYVYDDRRVLAILDGNNGLVSLFTNGPGIDSPLIMRRNGTDYFYHADALGNVNALTDSNGNVVETVAYQAYGKAMVKDAAGNTHDQSTVGNPFLYSSREYDSETGLYYLRARYYDAQVGRFYSEDPIPALNLYAYVDNNPIAFTDPLGLTLQSSAGSFGRGAALGFGSSVIVGGIAILITPIVGPGVVTTALIVGGAYGLWGAYDDLRNNWGNWDCVAFTAGNLFGGAVFGGFVGGFEVGGVRGLGQMWIGGGRQMAGKIGGKPSTVPESWKFWSADEGYGLNLNHDPSKGKLGNLWGVTKTGPTPWMGGTSATGVGVESVSKFNPCECNE